MFSTLSKNKIMRKPVFTVLWVLIGIGISGCKHPVTIKDHSALAVFKNVADSLFELKTPKSAEPIAYVIIPNTGCGGCISSVELLFADFVKKKLPVRFILTNISSLKSLRQTFGDSIVLRDNVYPDKANLVYSKVPQFTEIYPIIVYVEKGGYAVKYENVSPDTPNALEHFNKYVDSSMQGSGSLHLGN
jgi:hypothetical protein